MKLNDWIVENEAAYWRRGQDILTVKKAEDGLELDRLAVSAAMESGRSIISRNREAAEGPGLFICLARSGTPIMVYRFMTKPGNPQDAVSFARTFRPEQVFKLITERTGRGIQ